MEDSSYESVITAGYGLDGFRIGQSCWEAIAVLQARNEPCEVSWDRDKPGLNPVRLWLDRTKTSLLFDGVHQSLSIIELESDLRPERLLFARGRDTDQAQRLKTLDEDYVSESDIQRAFGPTFPASPSTLYKNDSVLIYPGIVFNFSQAKSFSAKRLTKLYICDKTYTTEKSAETLFKNVFLSSHAPDHSIALEVVSVGGTDQVIAEFTAGTNASKFIVGSTHQQDILCDLGSPDNTHFDPDEKLTSQNIDQVYFVNYFKYGIDFVIGNQTHVLQKIILHNNIPGEVQFGKYNRCRWTYKDSSSQCSSEDSVDSIVRSAALAAETATFMLQRAANAPSILGKETQLVRLPHMVLERTQSDYIETVWIS